MIIGNGDIASVLRDNKDLLFFASGVSNSQEDRESEYKREEELLYEQHIKSHFVYFSSLSIFYSNTRYTRHKMYMEDLVRARFKHYTIVRIGNITWGDNPHTFINYIRNKIKNKEPFQLIDEYRYVVDKDEFLHWIGMIPSWNCEMNIPGQRMKVKDVVEKYGYLDIHTK